MRPNLQPKVRERDGTEEEGALSHLKPVDLAGLLEPLQPNHIEFGPERHLGGERGGRLHDAI